MSLSSNSPKSMTQQRVVNSNLLQYANESRNEGHFNDVTIIVGNQSISGNRMVLSCHSVFFEKLFKCEMREKYEKEVEIQSVDGKSVKSLIDYMYVGNIDIDEENVFKLLAAADYLQLHDVKQFCFKFMESMITNDNWFDILKAVNLYIGDEIKNQIYDYISTHFDEIAQTGDFKALLIDELKECIANLNRNKVLVTSIYQGITIWIKHDPEARKDKLLDLFQLMKVDQLPFEFIEEVLKDDFVNNNLDCHKFLFATLLQNLRHQRDEVHGSKLICVGGSYTPSKVTEVYNLHGSKLTDYPDFPQNIYGHFLVNVNGYVYCIGGKTKTEVSKLLNNAWLCHVNDQCMNWKKAAPMKEKRWLMGATEHNGALVVAGGDNGVETLTSAELYEMPLNKWKPISAMNHRRSGNALVSCRGCLYALGGYSDGNVLSSVERLNDLEGEWEESRPMQKPRKWLVAVNCDNIVYAIGGKFGEDKSTTTKCVEKYDPDLNEWVYVSEMSTVRRLHAACVVNGKVYVVGGIDAKNHVVKAIECYTPSLDSWSVIGKTNDEWYYHSIVAL